MERKLIEAAQRGDVNSLFSMIKEHPLLLRSVTLSGGETPLHIACIAGHLNFVKEIINLRPEFATELNQDGFSPLHIASANGDLEIVCEFLRLNRDLRLVKGRERRIPLHCAVTKGRVEVIKELVSDNVDSIADTTARGETSLHLAVKNYQFEALRYMVEHLKKFNRVDVLNMKDDLGNTILHLAVSRKQYEVVDLLLNEKLVSKGVVEVNSLNRGDFTPLDVLLREGGDREIEEILRVAGATGIEDLHSSIQGEATQSYVVRIPSSSNGRSRTGHAHSPAKRLQDYFKYNESNESPSKTRDTMLVIAILIATGTYQAVLSPPGGVWQDDYKPSDNSTKHHTAGESVMGSHKLIAYGLFLVFNSIGFFMSLHIINFLTFGFPLQLELQVSILALIVTYDTSMAAIAPNQGISVLFTVLSILLPILIPIATRLARTSVKRSRVAIECPSPASA